MSDAALVDAQIALSDAVAAWCGRNVVAAIRRGQRDAAAQWCRLSAETRLDFGSRIVADATVEGAFVEPCSVPRVAAPTADRPVLRWLHVFSITYTTGGHTAIGRRWIEADPSSDVHDAVLTEQTLADAAPAFLEAVATRGGSTMALRPAVEGLAARADRLREIAAGYDAVVLHIHMWDPVPLMSFGTPGGPPVFLVNHADHVFWLGARIADRVINIRPSGEAVCVENRGVDRMVRLPLPLPRTFTTIDRALGVACRETLSIAPQAPVFLTIGTSYKYRPLAGFSFIDAAEQLLARVPDAHLIAVGPGDGASEWAGVRSTFAPRVHTVGVQQDVRPFVAAATVYLEGFPFGSLTALLEAVLGGLPPVLAPAQCPLPYRSDDFALASVSVPEDIPAYVREAEALATTSQVSHTDALRQRVVEAHCQPRWNAHLAEVRELVVSGLRHDVYPLAHAEPLDIERARYWARFLRGGNRENPFRAAFASALRRGLRPRVDRALARALEQARGTGLPVAHPLTAALGSRVLSVLPKRAALKYYVGE